MTAWIRRSSTGTDADAAGVRAAAVAFGVTMSPWWILGSCSAFGSGGSNELLNGS
jgi:hypothetical protein